MTFRRALSIGLLLLALVCAALLFSGCAVLLPPDINPSCPTYGGCDPISYPMPGLDLNGFGVMP